MNGGATLFLQIVIGVVTVCSAGALVALGRLIVTMRDNLRDVRNEVIPPPDTQRQSLSKQIAEVRDEIEEVRRNGSDRLRSILEEHGIIEGGPRPAIKPPP